MPSFTRFSKMNGGNTNGESRKIAADELMLATWDEDINAKIAYLYDYYHDGEPLKLRGLTPQKDNKKTPVEVKFIKTSSQTFDKDPITYKIQFKPGHVCKVPYYKECFEDRYQTEYPIGLYIDLPDEDGTYNRWLVVDRADSSRTQFPTYFVLQCDKIIQYVLNGVRWQIAAVMRSQNS